MTDFFSTLMASSDWTLIKYALLTYFGLLWFFIIIWVTRDALSRSNSIIFQMIAILLNILLPFLGVLLYLIIRPGKTQLERYYQDMESELLKNDSREGKGSMCEKCMMQTEKEYEFCPNCGTDLKKSCTGCKKKFPKVWPFCPFCGIEYKEKDAKIEKSKKTTAKAKDDGEENDLES